MNPWRWVPPAHSPLSWVALARSLFELDSTEAVESLLCERFEANAAHLVDSGTSALALAINLSVEQRPRRVVALPAYGCFDLATAADQADVEVALYDVDPQTLSADLNSLDQVLASGVASVVAVHLYGVPVNLAEIHRRCRQADALLIEDAAQGVGGSWTGKPLGAHGDLSVLSFGRGKGRSAGGGGALLVRDSRLDGRALQMVRSLPMAQQSGVKRALRMMGQDILSRPALYGAPARVQALGLGETPYHSAHPSERIAADSAGLVRAALNLESAESAARATRARRLQDLLPAGATPTLPDAGVAGYLRLPVLLQRTEGRGLQSSRQLGIERGYPRALTDLPGFNRASLTAGGPWEGARALAARLVTLPVHSRASDADLQRAAAWACERIG